jgi:hypothetical protein
MENVDSKEQITQTIQTFVNTGVQAVKPDITIEDFQNLNRISTIKNSSTSLSFRRDSFSIKLQSSTCMRSAPIFTFVNTGVQAVKPDITIEDFQNNNEQVLFYTGLPDFETFNALFESLKKIGAIMLHLQSDILLGTVFTNIHAI